eukprot:TRINITY_DN89516_c0_g1_i1.p1 TRINITY_DN89516_c0_g1~~TRINITY_DN89516_c0_g1_i1.p1  ORF type:complete len:563 (-),score=112.88 TRINITY_DN89516_c0_g1_i1:723-2222(-)
MLSIVGTVPVVPCASNLGGLGGKVDLDKELVVLGSGQMFVGAMTGMPGYQQVALSANMYIFGGSHRLAESVALCFVALVMALGVPVAEWTPKFFLGAVFFNLGMSFCKTHLYDNWGLMDRSSYCTMLLIVFIALWKDLTVAVAVGVGIQIVLMVRKAASMNSIYQCGTSDGGFISSRVRPIKDALRLRYSMLPQSALGRIEVVKLEGPIFFGNAPRLEDMVSKLLRVLRPRLTHLVVDLTRVTQVDTTGARALVSVARTAESSGLTSMAFVGASGSMRRHIETHQQAVPSTDSMSLALVDTLEEILEAYEDAVLEQCECQGDAQCHPAAEPPWDASETAKILDCWKRLRSRGELPGNLTHQHWEQIQAASSQQLTLSDGDLLCDIRDDVDGFWLLVEGQIVLESMRASKCRGMRSAEPVCKYAAPAAVGANEFFLHVSRHSFRMRARGCAVVLKLTEKDLGELKAKQPETYCTFLQEFLCNGLAAEGTQLRWRAALCHA